MQALPLNQTLIKITDLLSDGTYHDGTSLGEKLNITRAAVWKSIQKLEEYGVSVSAVKGKGYCLNTPLILLDPNKIQPFLRHSPELSVHLNIFEKIDSTNNIKNWAPHPQPMSDPSTRADPRTSRDPSANTKSGASTDFSTRSPNSNPSKKDIRVCMAEMQTVGRGRLNRQWHSPFGQNIYFSLVYSFNKDVGELSGLSLVLALAVCQAINTFLPADLDFPLAIKWPNDILVNQHKLAGILIELKAESNGYCQAIIGVGINVNMADSLETEISQKWSSLLKITGQHLDRNRISAELINTLLAYLERFSLGGMRSFMAEWQEKDVLFDYPVVISNHNGLHEGICVGINEQGHLLLQNKEGHIQAHSFGDVMLVST